MSQVAKAINKYINIIGVANIIVRAKNVLIIFGLYYFLAHNQSTHLNKQPSELFLMLPSMRRCHQRFSHSGLMPLYLRIRQPFFGLWTWFVINSLDSVLQILRDTLPPRR